jgi:hypothetical protein
VRDWVGFVLASGQPTRIIQAYCEKLGDMLPTAYPQLQASVRNWVRYAALSFLEKISIIIFKMGVFTTYKGMNRHFQHAVRLSV